MAKKTKAVENVTELVGKEACTPPEKKAPKAEKVSAKKADKAPKAERFTRKHAVGQILKAAKAPLTLTDWITRADDLFQQNGGASNLKESRYWIVNLLPVLEVLGIVTVAGDTITKA